MKRRARQQLQSTAAVHETDDGKNKRARCHWLIGDATSAGGKTTLTFPYSRSTVRVRVYSRQLMRMSFYWLYYYIVGRVALMNGSD